MFDHLARTCRIATFLIVAISALATSLPGTALGFWTTVTPIPTARAFGAAATGQDGLIYVFGGHNGSLLHTVEAYDPSTDTWATKNPMLTARDTNAAVTGPDGRIYAIGGAPPWDGVEVYD